MVFQCSFMVFHEYWLVSMVFHSTFIVFMIFGRFPWFFKVVLWFFKVVLWFFMNFG